MELGVDIMKIGFNTPKNQCVKNIIILCVPLRLCAFASGLKNIIILCVPLRLCVFASGLGSGNGTL